MVSGMPEAAMPSQKDNWIYTMILFQKDPWGQKSRGLQRLTSSSVEIIGKDRRGKPGRYRRVASNAYDRRGIVSSADEFGKDSSDRNEEIERGRE